MLTATPNTNSVFIGWTGDCSGSSTSCALTMNANKNVTATFKTTYEEPTVTVVGSGTVNKTPQPNATHTVANAKFELAHPAKAKDANSRCQ